MNRIRELRHLSRALKDDEKETPVLVFTGIGGMGKTALRIAFEDEILKPNKIPYAVLDYDGDPNLRSIEATLRTIRRQLSRHTVRTPVFDFLYARYYELSTGLKFSKKNYPPELEGVVTILTEIPGFGNVPKILYALSKIGLAVRERLLHKEWLYRIRDLEPREILNLLPEVLAEDLEEAMTVQTVKTVKQSGYRIPLLFDAYEFLADSHIDDTLHRQLLLFTPHLLRVIFTRTPLRWEHTYPKEWHGKITYVPSLDSLCQEDTTILLRKRHIEKAVLQEHLFQLTGGYPLHVELCADICREIKEATNREPEVHDFKGALQAKNLTEELVNRLLRQLTENESDLMELAAYPRWVSEEVLEVLSSVPESVPRIFKKFTKLSMFSPHAEIPDAYVIRKEVRNYLMQRQRRERLFKERHGKLSAFHRERWEETKSFHHLREALYHLFYENSEQAMQMFEEHFWKLLEKFSFAEAESLLEAIPMEILTKKQKRKVDYARARFLSVMARSPQSLTTARKLYEALIESESEAASRSQYLYSFGKLLGSMGDYIRALESHKNALDIRLKLYGKDHPKVAASYNNIGIVFAAQGEYSKALEYHQKAFTFFLKTYGDNHPKVAASYHNIGIVFHEQGEYGNALEYFQKACAIFLKTYGENHPKVAASYNNIGENYRRQCEYGKALEYYQKYLAISLKIYGKDHPRAATAYHNIGEVHREQGEYGKALEYHQKAFNIHLTAYGPENLKLANFYNSTGIIFDEQGEYGKALEHYQKALTIYRKAYGEDHPNVADCYNNIGESYTDQGEYSKALEHLQKSFVIRLKVYGEDHPQVAASYNNIGVVYRAQGECSKALERFKKSLAIFLKIHRQGHPCVAESYSEVGKTLWILKRKEEALAMVRQSVKTYWQFKRCKDVVECLKTLASWLEEMGRKEEAEEARVEADKIREEHGLH